MKNFNEFVNTMLERAKETYGNDSARLETVRKTNDINLMALVITAGDTNIYPTIYLEEYYEDYKRGKTEETIFTEIVQIYEHHKLDAHLDVSCFSDYEKIKDKITFRLINTAKNLESLKEMPHRDFLNLSIVYSLLLDNRDSIMASSMIKTSHIEVWGVNEQDLYNQAMKNTPRLLTPNLMSLSEMISGMLGEDFAEEATEAPMKVLTNSQRTHGASCILYPDYLKTIAKELNSDLIILPSSTHETMILRLEDDAASFEDYASLVKEVNNTQVQACDYLSDNCYLYSREKDQIEIAA